mmetsp:Transcript_1130/g.5022  ORF Transcript_1130/g.5022 Transcript_1130/m.5022 type:complete len:347 (-) Transcript_1130:435-1475(-)
MFASFLTIRWSVVLSVMPSSTTVAPSSSSVRPSSATTSERSFISVSGACSSLDPPCSSASAWTMNFLRSATVWCLSRGSQYSRSSTTPSSSTPAAALTQMYCMSRRRIMSSRYAGEEHSSSTSSSVASGSSSLSSSISDRLDADAELAGRRSLRVTSPPPRLSISVFPPLAPDIQSGLSFNVRLVTTWFLRTSTGLELPLASNTRMSVAARDEARGAPSGDVGESLSSPPASPPMSAPNVSSESHSSAHAFVGDATMPSLEALNTKSSSSSSVSSRSAVRSEEWKPSMRFVGGGVLRFWFCACVSDGLGRLVGSSCPPGVRTFGRFTGGAAGGLGSMRLNIERSCF